MNDDEIIKELKHIERISKIWRTRWDNPPERYDYKGNFDLEALVKHIEEELTTLIKKVKDQINPCEKCAHHSKGCDQSGCEKRSMFIPKE
jgi:hypothetical protein